MHAFRKTLNAFCQEILGMTMDSKDMLELESSTAKKFSRHVIVKALLDQQTGETTKKALAFANNAQAGLLVDHLVKYAESHRHDSQSLSKYLFVGAPDRKDGCEGREVCVIDESVYSRNRSFRLLFQSKFGKDRTLELDHDRCDPYFGGPKPFPCIALVQTMASFVPGGTQLFQHHLIPSDYGHLQAKASRVLKGGSVVIRRDNGSTCTVQCDPLLNHLVRFWDDIRCDNERRPERNWPETTVQSSVEMDGRIMTITLGNNRFCFCKKASHLSNHVYLVVDLLRAEFYQNLAGHSWMLVGGIFWIVTWDPCCKLTFSATVLCRNQWDSSHRNDRDCCSRGCGSSFSFWSAKEVLWSWLSWIRIADLQATILDCGKHAGGYWETCPSPDCSSRDAKMHF